MNKSKLYDLTIPQKSIFLTEQYASGTSINMISGNIIINETVDLNLLEKALNLYVQKNDAIRLRICIKNGEPKQYISEYSPFKLKTVKLSEKQELSEFNQSILNTPFSFIDSDLFSFTLFDFSNGTGGLNVTFHHIISDAWTMSLFVDQVINLYTSLLNRTQIDTSVDYTYTEFINTQNEYLTDSHFQKDKNFWNSIFDSEPTISHISSGNTNNSNTLAKRLSFCLDESIYSNIDQFCKKNNCSIFAFFMAIYSIYLSKLNNTHSPILGTPILNRTNFKEKHTCGMFISTVPFKTTFDSNSSFTEYLKSVSLSLLQILRHQRYPYDILLQDIKEKYNLNENLFDLVVSYQNARDNKQDSNINYETNWIFSNNIANSLEIHFYDMDNTGTLNVYYDFQVSKFIEQDIYDLHSRILNIINIILSNSNINIKDIPLITKEEENKFLNNFNYSSFNYDKEIPLIKFFENNVSNFPKKTAIIFENNKLSYQELNNSANIISNKLINLGIHNNQIIGIMLKRSFETLISVLGVLKSGAGYMLIDPTLPKDRIEYMLKNANSPLLITNKSMDIKFDNKLFVDDIDFTNQIPNPVVQTSNEDSFCTIYTSGSTGTPKGVELKRIGIINMLNSYKKFLNTDKCNNFLSTSTVAFDMFIVENFVSLLSGKTIILANEEEQKVPAFMSELIKKYNVDFILSTPSKMELLLLNDKTKSSLKNVKVIQLGGEVFKSSLYERLRECSNAKIFNGYGPSECTACCSNKEIINSNEINIGIPFLNTRIYILNDDLNMLPVGYSGEICVCGDGVSKGYINNPEITNKSFVKDIFSNQIMYKTGDIGKYNKDGELIYIGRRDAQIKLHGLRIELDEITSKITKIDGINNAISIIKKVNNIDCICSYVVGSKNISEEDIKSELKQELPYYMIPSHIVFLDNLPITLNGKVDTKKLPDININDVKFIPPTTELEKKLSTLWSKILDVKDISIESDFFNIGGDSLCSIKLVSEIYSELGIKIYITDIFKYSTIKSLSSYIETKINKENTQKTIILKASKQESYPLSSAQKRIYFTINMNPSTITYNTPGALLFDKCPDITKLENSLNTLLNNNNAFKTYFSVEESEVVQKLVENINFKLEVIHEKEKNLENIFSSFLKPFDLSKAPLFRAELHVFTDNSSALFIDIHHIICDGESINIFINNLCNLYNGKPVVSSNIDYIDYSMWENEKIKTNKYEEGKNYWLKQLSGELPVLNMPTTYHRPSVQSFDGNKIYKTISNEKISEFCKRHSCTPFSLLLSIYYILLYKYTNQTDIIVGTPIVGRDNSQLHNIIGMFVNTLPLRAKIDSKESFTNFLKIININNISSFENQTYPFDELLKDLNIARDTSRNPLFDTMFIYQNNGKPKVNLNGINTSYYIPDNNSSKFDFSLELIPSGKDLNLTLEYCTKLYSKEFMNNFLLHYINILNVVLANPNIQISEICMLSEEELDYIFNKYNNNKLDYPANETIINLFNTISENNKKNIAIIYKNTKLTYEELNEKVIKFATYLLSLGIKKGDIVGVFINRSINLIVAMLGIMRCGAIYLPISTALPQDRINYIVQDSKAKKVLVDNSTKSLLPNNNFINMDEINFENIDNVQEFEPTVSDDIIYIIYTSGSTGLPKGVKICNKNLTNFIHSFRKLFDYSINNNDICLSTVSISFDVSIWEFFFTLLNGATLYLYPHESIEDILDYCKTIIKNKITMAYIPPNILQEVYSILSGNEIHLNKILIGVEPIKGNIINKYFSLSKNMKIINGYGPTETTICCTAFNVKKGVDILYNIIPIGKPLYNLKAYILDKDLQPLPIGIPGELYISGYNVGKGYLNNDTLTNERYLISKFNNQEIMYKTGDVVKMLPDGNISFVGRNDNQIKIKGHRIELSEISNTIVRYPTINKCQLIVKEENNNKYLIAYFTASKKVVINDLRSFLSSKLPFYSIPNLLIQLDKFVLTPNGKIDVKYLSNISVKLNSEYEPPHTDLEKKLVKLWQQYLGVEKIGINDNFFELGGDSLIAIKLQIEIFKLGINITYSDIFTHPTIKELINKTSTVTHTSKEINYNYSQINNLISKNCEPISNSDIQKIKIDGILLTGVTGFVGIHILDKLLTNTNATICCLIRKKDGTDVTSRFIKTLHFYFEDKYDGFIGNRIRIVEGDISLEHLGLSHEIYDILGNKISCVINSAAVVKHFGSKELFDKTNISGVQNIIDFCNNFNIKLYHISTLSVSGNVFAEDSFTGSSIENKTTFKESNLYINQDLSNIYIYTKFIAERLILENVANNTISATIIRLGNITSRYSDGKFQINVSENAFLNRLKTFINLKYIPDNLRTGYLEFTPVDICANAIVKIIQNNLEYTIFHLYNNNHIPLTDTVKYMNEYGLDIKFINNKSFLEVINTTLQENKSILSGIINDFDDNKKLVYESNVSLNNTFTNSVLSKIGFNWPKIEKKYIFKYLDYLKNIGYLF